MENEQERLAWLDATHAPGLDDVTKRVLVARAAGRSFEEAGSDASYHERTARDRVEKALYAVFHPIGLRSSGWPAGYWVGRHLGCCLQPQETQQELPPGLPQKM
jgi:hypothetical protein